MKPRLDSSFLVSGALYILLAVLTLISWVTFSIPVYQIILETRPQPIELVPTIFITFLFAFFTLFYGFMAYLILMRQRRSWAVVGGIASCFFIPFGSVAGLVFVFWTRRRWRVAEVAEQDAAANP